MANASNYLEAQLINHLLRTGTFAKPAGIYVAAFTSDPTDAGSGTEVSTSGTAYARVQVTQADAQWTAPGVAGTTDNVNAITFAKATASWGTVTHFGIFDAASGGNLLIHGALTASKTIGTNDRLQFDVGDLDVTVA